MENCFVNENANNDFLSQSYSQGIERITGTKDSTFNFQIPKEILEIREKTWDNLFDKYSKEMSDDIELNVDTLEPEEEEEETAISEEEFSYGQRVPMRKPATLVQYWINTGNPPYKALLDENELSETDLSLSEKETARLLTFSVLNTTNTIDTDDNQEHKIDSSCSSVDTAVYILSNANVTKKANAIALIEGAKDIEIKSLKDISVKNIGASSNDKIECMETTKIKHIIHDNNGDINIHAPDTKLYPMSRTKYKSSEISDGMIASTLVSVNAIQSNIYSQNVYCEETNKIDESNTSQRNLDVQTMNNIASIFQQFNKTSKRLVVSDKSNDVLDRDKILEMDTFHERQISDNIVHEITAKDTNLTPLHRKKLYTGRDSPVDLILTETHGTNRLSGTRQSLHPALDPDGTIKEKTFLVHKDENKHSPSTKKNLDSKQVKRKEQRELSCISNKTILNISNKYTNDKIQNFDIDSCFKNLSDLYDNLHRQRDDIPCQERNDTNVKNKNCKQNLTSLNLKPIVLLKRIKFPSKRRKFQFGENTHSDQKKNIHNDKCLNKGKKLYSCETGNVEIEMINSDESAIPVYQCNINASRRTSSLNACPLDLRLNLKDDFASNAERKDDKLSSLKDTDINQNKERRIVERLSRSLTRDYTNETAMESQVSNKNNTCWQNVLSNKYKTCSHLYGKNKADNVKLKEIKVVLERLPVKSYSMMKMQALNKNDATWKKEMSDKSEAHFSNPYEANKEDNVKLREIKVVLERLPANIYLKEIHNDVTNTNIFLNKKILQNTSLQTNHKQKYQNRKSSKILACENGAAICNNYSLRMNIKSKKNNDRIDIFDIVTETEPNSIFQQETSFQRQSHNEPSQDNCYRKYSILTVTSDEDDFVKSIQHPRKRSKISINDNIFGESNIAEKNFCNQTKLVMSDKNKDYSSKNLSTVICSSEETVQKDIRSIKKKKKNNGDVKIKSFDSMQMTDSLRKHERFVFFSSEDDNDSAADNSDKCRVRISFLNAEKVKINNSSKKQLNGAIKKNGIDHKDVQVTNFQTKTFDTSSSDFEESNNSSKSKSLKSSSIRHKLRYHNRANSEKIFNNSIAKRYSKEQLSSLNSFLEKHNRMHDVRTRSRSLNKEAKAMNERLANEESGDVESRISNTRKDVASSSPINDVRNTYKKKTQHIQEKMSSNTLFKKANLDRSLSENKEISDKSKNSLILQSEMHITSTVQNLTFQTKSYYDSSDSSETL